MAQNSFYVLFGHGSPVEKRKLTNVPDNGTMIKTIPGTCASMFTTPATRRAMHYRNTTPAELVDILNDIKSEKNPDDRHAFRIYEPNTTYSDSQIMIEGTELHRYVFGETQVSVYNDTDLLHQSITHNPDPHCFPLSRVNRYLALLGKPYTLVVLSCMQIDPATDADVNALLSSGDYSVDAVHEMLKEMGYYGGNNSRMIKRSMGKKRRNRKTTQRKKTHAKRMNRTYHNS